MKCMRNNVHLQLVMRVIEKILDNGPIAIKVYFNKSVNFLQSFNG